MTNKPSLGLIAPLAFAIALVACWISADLPWLGIIAVPLIIVLPGYTLSWAIFPRSMLGGLERIVMSCGISLTTVVIGGIVLNMTPWGLQTASWVVLLGGISVGAILVALVRHRGEPANLASLMSSLCAQLRHHYNVSFASAVLITLAAMALAYTGALHQPGAGFTELWMRPNNINASERVVELGVLNMETSTTQYRLVVEVDGKVVHEWQSLQLQPGESWAANFALSLLTSNATTEVKLFRDDLPNTIYRQVHLQGDVQR